MATSASARLSVLTLWLFAVRTISTNAWLRVQPRSARSTPSAVSSIRAPARRGSGDRLAMSTGTHLLQLQLPPAAQEITYDEKYIFPSAAGTCQVRPRSRSSSGNGTIMALSVMLGGVAG